MPLGPGGMEAAWKSMNSSGIFSLLMETAMGPRFSSTPKKFWCSEGREILVVIAASKANL